MISLISLVLLMILLVLLSLFIRIENASDFNWWDTHSDLPYIESKAANVFVAHVGFHTDYSLGIVQNHIIHFSLDSLAFDIH